MIYYEYSFQTVGDSDSRVRVPPRAKASWFLTEVIMRRDEVLLIVKAHQAKLQELGVESLGLFGSVARDEARPDSDVDFLVEFSRPVGFFEFFQIQHYLEDILGRDIDLGTQDALREHLREPVFKDVIRVF